MDTMEEIDAHELEVALKPIYGILNEEGYLVDVTLEETAHLLGDIPEDMETDDYKALIEFDTYTIRVVDGVMLYVDEKDESDNDVVDYQAVLQRLETLEETVKTLQLTLDNLTSDVEHEVEIETED